MAARKLTFKTAIDLRPCGRYSLARRDRWIAFGLVRQHCEIELRKAFWIRHRSYLNDLSMLE